MLRPFALYRPTTVAEASELLAREGADASLYAGGDEVLTAVRLTPWPAHTTGAYAKFGVHERPTLGVAVALTRAGAAVGAARVAVGCVGPRPLRVAAAEERLRGWSLDDVARHADE